MQFMLLHFHTTVLDCHVVSSQGDRLYHGSPTRLLQYDNLMLARFSQVDEKQI